MKRAYLSLTLVAAAAAAAVYVISTSGAASGQTHRDANPSPSAAQFASDVVATATAYAESHGDTARLAHADCVKASSVHFMCSYAVVRPHRPRECHLMQATWTPNSASSYKVTLAGRVARCGTLREALRSLR